MSIINAVRTLATIRNVPIDIHREALRLAAEAAPKVGRSGWAEAQAEGLLAQANKNVEAERLDRANEALRLVVTIQEAEEQFEAGWQCGLGGHTFMGMDDEHCARCGDWVGPVEV